MFLTLNRRFFAPEGVAAGGDPGPGAPAPAPAPNGTPPAPGESFDFPKWRDSLPDPKLKAAAERYNSIEDMLTSNVTLRGEIADRIRLPGPNATPEDLTKFRRGLGVPDDPKGYEVKLPEGMNASEMDQTLIDAVRPIAHASNMSGKAFNELITGMMTKAKEVEAQAEKALKDAAMVSVATLRKEWGSEYDKTKELGVRTVKAFTSEQDFKSLDEAVIEGFGKLGDWPPFARLMASIGKRADEGELMVGGGGAEAKQTAQQELNTLIAANPPGSDGYVKNQARIQELYGIIHGKGSIVGGQGRTL